MNCPTCNSPQPHLHPAVQAEGEVHICPNREYHGKITPENTPEKIASNYPEPNPF